MCRAQRQTPTSVTSVKLRYSFRHLLTVSVRPFKQSEGRSKRIGNHRDLASMAINSRLDQHTATEGHAFCGHLDRIFDTHGIERGRMQSGFTRGQRSHTRTSIVLGRKQEMLGAFTCGQLEDFVVE